MKEDMRKALEFSSWISVLFLVIVVGFSNQLDALFSKPLITFFGLLFIATATWSFAQRRIDRFAQLDDIQDLEQRRSEKQWAIIGTILMGSLLALAAIQVFLLILFLGAF